MRISDSQLKSLIREELGMLFEDNEPGVVHQHPHSSESPPHPRPGASRELRGKKKVAKTLEKITAILATLSDEDARKLDIELQQALESLGPESGTLVGEPRIGIGGTEKR